MAMKKRSRASQSIFFSPDYLLFFALIIIIAAVSAWQIPSRLSVQSETALMYCNDAYLDRVEYSSSTKTVKVVSTLLGGGAVYHIINEKSFQCPVVAPNMMSDACRDMLEVNDWDLVCEGEKDVLRDEGLGQENDIKEREEVMPRHDDIQVLSPRPFKKVSSPLHVEGEAKGTWFFEGDFPIEILNEEGDVLGEGYATAKGEWMTEDFVSFEADIPFVIDDTKEHVQGTIILYEDNPSGLFELDDMFMVPVLFVGEAFATSTPSIIRKEAI
ncbi:MAG: Gmad2 immunoglobulin-like domain-containing protein [Parcubacteria group bacterium]|nr:Gmad2 immunoglobulin-like domain-containing protein [Parcubacteria group bacterium]